MEHYRLGRMGEGEGELAGMREKMGLREEAGEVSIRGGRRWMA